MTTTIFARFEETPLLTPERISANVEAAFAVRPEWGQHLVWVEDQEPGAAAVITLGFEHKECFIMTAVSVALLFELTRFGGFATMNGNRPGGRYYPRLMPPGPSRKLIQIPRLLYGADPYEQIKRSKDKLDLRPFSFRAIAGEKIAKDARGEATRAAREAAEDWEANGKMPSHITAAAYVENIEALFEAVDAEASDARA